MKYSKIRNCLSQDKAELLVHAFISSKLDFCHALPYGLPYGYSMSKTAQLHCRLVSRTRSTEHITPILCRLHWLPIRQRIMYKVLHLTFKALNGMAPKYMADLFQYYTPTRQLRSSSKNLLLINTKIKSQVLWRQIVSSCCSQTLEWATR